MPTDEPTLHTVKLTICNLCLDGAGGECHTPGCALWINRAPDLPLRDKLEPGPDLRSLAVEIVDMVHGHTMEFAGSPEAHREDYDHAKRILGRNL